MSPTPANPQSHLKLDPTHDVMFECDLCDFVAYGPTALEDHIREAHSVPAASVGGIGIHEANAEPYRRKRDRDSG